VACFRFDRRWYRDEVVAALVLSYYVVLRSVLRLKPGLRKCLARCRHCGIFFLTDVRNAGRLDLGCPFGCSQAHRQRQSTRRSVAYYREPEGQVKKRELNAQPQEIIGSDFSGQPKSSRAQPTHSPATRCPSL